MRSAFVLPRRINGTPSQEEDSTLRTYHVQCKGSAEIVVIEAEKHVRGRNRLTLFRDQKTIGDFTNVEAWWFEE